MYIISRCLLGSNCKYNGGNNRCEPVIRFAREHSCCSVCPETAGGLKSPRPPAEFQGSRVRDRNGKDVTEAFVKGAQESWEQARSAAEQRGEPIEGAILKANSPSCGCGSIYDGTFSGQKIPGDGCFTRVLKEQGVEHIITEKELEE